MSRSAEKSETVAVTVVFKNRREKSMRVQLLNGGTKILPISQIKNLRTVMGDAVEGRRVTLSIPKWLAEKEGLS